MTVDEARTHIGKRARGRDGHTWFTGVLSIVGETGVSILNWESRARTWYVYTESLELVDEVVPAAPFASRDFPHECPRCSGPAYIGFRSIDCQAGCGS